LVFGFSKKQILVAVILGQNSFWIIAKNHFEMSINHIVWTFWILFIGICLLFACLPTRHGFYYLVLIKHPEKFY
jgi:hypothetical protein